MFSHPNNLKEASDLFNQLSENVFELKESITSKKWDKSDARQMALGNLYQHLTTPVFILNILSNFEKSADNLVSFARQANLIDGNPNKAFGDIEMFTKRGIVLNIQFEIENLFVNLLKELGEINIPLGFRKRAQMLIDHVSVTEKKRKVDELQIGACIRNSLHSNGVHHGKYARFKLNGIEFIFESGKVHYCSGWGHIYLVCKNSLQIVKEILLTIEIGSIKGPIQDGFAWSNHPQI